MHLFLLSIVVFLVCIESPQQHATEILAEFERLGYLEERFSVCMIMKFLSCTTESGSCLRWERNRSETETSNGQKRTWTSQNYSVRDNHNNIRRPCY